jgi:broad specificity phosphatase PhoE
LIVWLARHGESTARRGLALGWSDPPLSETGVAQARALSDQLRGRKLAGVYASDLTRARATAEHVARPHGLPVLLTTDLRELNFGSWEGRDLAELWTERPAEARAWEADIRRTPPAFGETVADLEERVARFFGVLTASPAGEVAVVAHMGSLAALRARIEAIDFAESWRARLELGACARLELRC